MPRPPSWLSILEEDFLRIGRREHLSNASRSNRRRPLAPPTIPQQNAYTADARSFGAGDPCTRPFSHARGHIKTKAQDRRGWRSVCDWPQPWRPWIRRAPRTGIRRHHGNRAHGCRRSKPAHAARTAWLRTTPGTKVAAELHLQVVLLELPPIRSARPDHSDTQKDIEFDGRELRAHQPFERSVPHAPDAVTAIRRGREMPPTGR